MTNKNDGGNAFPLVVPAPGFQQIIPGMTLRQWYKGMALQVIISDFEALKFYMRHYEEKSISTSVVDMVAIAASKYADALIAEDEEFERKTNGN